MDTKPICHDAASINSKQKEVVALPLIIGAKEDESDRAKSKEPIRT